MDVATPTKLICVVGLHGQLYCFHPRPEPDLTLKTYLSCSAVCYKTATNFRVVVGPDATVIASLDWRRTMSAADMGLVAMDPFDLSAQGNAPAGNHLHPFESDDKKTYGLFLGGLGSFGSNSSSSCDAFVASVCHNGYVVLWNARTQEEISRIKSPVPKVSYALTSVPKTDQICVGGGSPNLVFLYDMSKSECVQRLKGHDNTIYGMASGGTFDANLMYSTAVDSRSHAWDLRVGTSVQDWKHPNMGNSLYFAADKRLLLVGLQGGLVQFIDVRKPLVENVIDVHKGGAGLFLSAIDRVSEDEFVSVCDDDCSVVVWSLEGKRLGRTQVENKNYGVCVVDQNEQLGDSGARLTGEELVERTEFIRGHDGIGMLWTTVRVSSIRLSVPSFLLWGKIEQQ